MKVIIPADYAEQMSNILVKEWKYYDDSYEEGNDRQKLTDDFKTDDERILATQSIWSAFFEGYRYDDWICNLQFV